MKKKRETKKSILQSVTFCLPLKSIDILCNILFLKNGTTKIDGRTDEQIKLKYHNLFI